MASRMSTGQALRVSTFANADTPLICQQLTKMSFAMKAIVLTAYGLPIERLQLKELPKPAPGPNEVLIRVHAAAVNDYDWSMARGRPYPYRLLFGLWKPKRPVPGMEVSGTVEARGERATAFEVGDAVYGDISDYGFGSFAEYLCIDERGVVRKPAAMSFAEAAATPHAALLAYQGLVELGKIQRGQRVLINGAGGGVGTFGLQLAKRYDAEVTGVDTGAKLEMMKGLGFDHVLDYREADFTKTGERYDLILDAKTNRAPGAYARALRPGGAYVTVGGKLGRLLQLLLMKRWFKGKRLELLALKPNRQLVRINELFEAGHLKPVIDGPYPLREAPRAVQYFGEGKHYGKVVIALTGT